MTSDYNELCTALVVSIKLGYEAEADDPNLSYEAPVNGQVVVPAGGQLKVPTPRG